MLRTHVIRFIVYACRFYKLHERKCEPIVMTVPRKVSRRRPQQPLHSLQHPLIMGLLTRPSVLLPSVRPVSGWLVPGYGWSGPSPGGWGVVWWQERRPHLNLPQEWLRSRQEPRIQSGQKERFGQQGYQENWELIPGDQVCPLSSINCEYLFLLTPLFHCRGLALLHSSDVWSLWLVTKCQRQQKNQSCTDRPTRRK